MNRRRNDLEIMNWIPQIALQIQNSDRSPLYDVRNPARASPEGRDVRSDVSRTMFGSALWASMVSPSSLFRASTRQPLPPSACRAEAGEACKGWWSQTGSNRRPHACKARALPAELWPRTRRRMLLSRFLRARLRWRYGAAAFVQEGLPSRSCRAAKAGGPGKT